MQVFLSEREDGKQHHGDLKDLCADGDVAFAEAIRQVSTRHRKQDERARKQSADKQDFAVFLLGFQRHREDEKDDEVLQPVLVEGALELRGDQAPEAAAPIGFLVGHGPPLRRQPQMLSASARFFI